MKLQMEYDIGPIDAFICNSKVTLAFDIFEISYDVESNDLASQTGKSYHKRNSEDSIADD